MEDSFEHGIIRAYIDNTGVWYEDIPEDIVESFRPTREKIQSALELQPKNITLKEAREQISRKS